MKRVARNVGFIIFLALLIPGTQQALTVQPAPGGPFTPGQTLSANSIQEGTAPKEIRAPGSILAVDSVAGNLHYVPAGVFLQGSPESEKGRTEWERPFLHTITRDLLVMETEVTREMWATLGDLQPRLPAPRSDSRSKEFLPARFVTWYEAVLFSNLLSIQQGLTPAYYKDIHFRSPIIASDDFKEGIYCDFQATGYRLPTEGEWEYFARAGTTTPFSEEEPAYGLLEKFLPQKAALFGLEKVAWFSDGFEETGIEPKPVGQKRANPWGIKDVHGNVSEWCWDWWGSYPQGSSVDYTGLESGVTRVVRGGSWVDPPSLVRSAGRNAMYPESFQLKAVDGPGFRLVRTMTMADPPAILAASPETCQISAGAGVCTVTLQVANPNALALQIWVRDGGGQEKQVTGSINNTTYSLSIPWIGSGSYLFLLYDVGKTEKLLISSVNVKGVPLNNAVLTASASSCSIPIGTSFCFVNLQVSNPAGILLQIWRRDAANQEIAITGPFNSTSLIQPFPWVSAGLTTFLLYDISDGGRHLISSMQVSGLPAFKPTLAANPNACQIPQGGSNCSIILISDSPGGIPLQIWVRDPDNQDKQVTGTFNGSNFTLHGN